MFFVIEGADGTGKSTLAGELKGRIEETLRGPVLIMHRGPLKRDPFDEYETDALDYRPTAALQADRQHLIADRWHWGELVYGPLYRGGSKLTKAGFRHVELFLRSRGAVPILCNVETETVRARLYARGEEFLRPEHLERVQREFMEIALERSLLAPSMYPSGNGMDLLKRGVILQEHTARLQDFPQYIGDPKPRVLLLGEARVDPTDPNPLPFVPRSASSSGEYLLTHLPEQLYRSCGIANALEVKVPQLWAALGYPPVVALGGVAEAACRLLPHSTVPHPQWVRRFHHHEGERYGDLLLRAARTMGLRVLGREWEWEAGR